MKNTNNKNISIERLEYGLNLAFTKMLKEKIKNNQKIIISKNGKTVSIDALKYAQENNIIFENN